MRGRVGWLCVPALAAGCYLRPETTGEVVAVEGGATAVDAGWSMDAELAVDAGPPDTGPVDAGCSSSQAVPGGRARVQQWRVHAVQAPRGLRGVRHHAGVRPQRCVRFVRARSKASVYRCDSRLRSKDQRLRSLRRGRRLPERQSAACQPNRTCGLCTEDADCSRFGKVCDSRTGTCVQCRLESEEVDCRTDKACDAKTADCAGTACDPKTLTCTTKTRGTVATCQSCLADSECVASHRCIPLFFGEGENKKALGGYCMKQATSGCARPYGTPISRESLSGKAAESYCGLAEAVATCEARTALVENKPCSGSDDSCGVSGGLCKTVNFIADSCTYACRSALDCPAQIPCGGPEGASYCGGSL